MRSKRGQFYLIAATLIIIVLVTFATILNYSRNNNSVTLYDLGEELGIESQNVLDYGTANPGEDMNSLLEGFISDYVDYVGEGKKFYFVYGNTLGTHKVECDGTSCEPASSISSSGGVVSVEIDSIVYQFDLVDNQNFYFVISQEIEGEKHVVTG